MARRTHPEVLVGLGYEDIRVGDLLQVRHQGGLRDARVTGRDPDGAPLVRS